MCVCVSAFIPLTDEGAAQPACTLGCAPRVGPNGAAVPPLLPLAVGSEQNIS